MSEADCLLNFLKNIWIYLGRDRRKDGRRYSNETVNQTTRILVE